jgi:hypothetical protein
MSKTIFGLLTLVLGITALTGAAPAQTIVQNRDEPGRNRYQAHATISAPCSFQNGCVATFATIPAGEHVVVQYVSCFITIGDGITPLVVSLAGQVSNPNNRAYLPSLQQGSVSNVQSFVVSSPLVYYFVSGDTPTISVLFNGAPASNPGDCLLTGYHVLIP